jgi:hypothetical protein
LTPNHEKLLVAILAGLIIAGAAAFAINPALASTTGSNRSADFAVSTVQLLPQLPSKG